MDYTIVTFGDFGLMVMALNGIAAITNHSSFAFIPLIGVMTGMFFLVSRYLTTMRIDLHHLLTGFILFNVMFVPKVDVLVESATGQVQPVANVPVGLATPLSITTIMGRYFAEQFETVFSVASNASLLEHGYMDALTTLIKIRDFDIQTTDANSSTSSGLKQDVHKTIMSYLTECVFYDIYSTNPSISWPQIRQYSGPNIWEALKTEYVNIDATSYLYSTTSPVQRNCALLWEDLNAEVFDNPAKTEEISKGILKMLGKAQIAGSTYTDRVGYALEAIRINSDQAQRYMYNSLMISWLNEADGLYSMKASDLGSTIMKSQASAQNNLRWAAEQSQFERYAKPIISFIELFVVAATPIMAFIIVAFGTTGLALAFKYLLMLVWVSFWAPTLSLANFFIHYKIVDYIEYLASQKTPVAMNDSVLNLGELPFLWTQLQDWVGVGGMMAAATPALTLMLLYGTSQTAVNLASKLNQGERVDEKTMAPDLVKQAPLTALTSNNTGNTDTGIKNSGSGVFDPAFNFSQGASSSLKIAQSQLQSMNQTMQTQYGLGNTSSAQAQLSENFDKALSNSKDSTLQRQHSELFNKLQSIGEANGLTKEEAQTAGKTAIANGGLGLPNMGITMGVQLGKTHSNQEAARRSQAYDDQVRAAIQTSELFSKSNRSSEAFSNGFRQTNTGSITEAQQESKQRTELYGKMQSASKLVSATDSFDKAKGVNSVGNFSDLAARYQHSEQAHGYDMSPDVINKANDYAAKDPDFAKQLDLNKRIFRSNMANSPQQTNLMAALKTMALSNNNDAQADFYNGVSKLLNVPGSEPTDNYNATVAMEGMDTDLSKKVESKAPAQGSVSAKTGDLTFNNKTPTANQLRNAPTNKGADRAKIKEMRRFGGEEPIFNGTQSPNGAQPNTPSFGEPTGPAFPSTPQQPTGPRATLTAGKINKPKQPSSPKSKPSSKDNGNDQNTLTIGTGYREFANQEADIIPAMGSSVPHAIERQEKNPIHLHGLNPEFQNHEFKDLMRSQIRQTNSQAIAQGKQGTGKQLEGYGADQTPASRLVLDGVNQDKEFHDKAESLLPGAGGFIYDNASAFLGGAGLVSQPAKLAAKRTLSKVAKNASAEVTKQGVNTATKRASQIVLTGGAVGVAAEKPVRQSLTEYSLPNNVQQSYDPYITPPPKK